MMIGFLGSVLSDSLVGGSAVLMVAATAFLMRDSIHSGRLRRRQQRDRERTRREFWGFE